MKDDAVTARFVAQQIACGSRDDVFAATPPLAVARCWHWQPAVEQTITDTLACSTSKQLSRTPGC